jgi:hypothetical protein
MDTSADVSKIRHFVLNVEFSEAMKKNVLEIIYTGSLVVLFLNGITF